jgi:ADP-ribosylglycohydrolase/catechol 2,3-dioxygenase-like lactoylglutathione lyase family enzyme
MKGAMPKELTATVTTIKEKAHGAFWGAAFGDALGWPQEMPRRRVRRNQAPPDATVFETWDRRSGGRFMPHEETIQAGEYSDDTQLILCTARSILRGPEWLNHLAYVELPAWTVYQRGGGGATTRAVDILLAGELPWRSTIEADKRRKYFDAGGNGVAMRIVPHSLWGARHANFKTIARAIFLNGICTHGHPRALMGALLYGYAAWRAFQQSGTLTYGHLLEVALADRDVWASLPQFDHILAGWKDAAEECSGGRFQELWDRTADEMYYLLKGALGGIRVGALSMDSDVLSQLGCFDPARNGAGTVSTAASLFLASKYAPDPQHGVRVAATSTGADTDTLASMTGALLGIISGTEWLQSCVNHLQDAAYLAKSAELVCDETLDPVWGEALRRPETRPKANISRFLDQLLRSEKGAHLRLPDGREAVLHSVEPLRTSSKTLRPRLWKLTSMDEQTLYVKRLERLTTNVNEQNILGFNQRETSKKATRLNSKIQAVKLLVSSLENARRFYGDIFGLKVARESKGLVNFGKILSLVPLDYAKEVGLWGDTIGFPRAIVCLEASSLDICHERVSAIPESKATAILQKAGRRVFRCLDPDRNVVEVFEIVRGQLGPPVR